MKNKFLLALSFFSLTYLLGASTIKKDWSKPPFESNLFIENKGQFVAEDKNQKIFFGAEENGCKLLFTGNSLIYRFDEIKIDEKKQAKLESIEKQENKASISERKAKRIQKTEEALKAELVSVNSYFVSAEWVGANKDCKVVSEIKDKEEFTYDLGHSQPKTVRAHGYRKLIYKQLYPLIDVEYTFSEKTGIKYCLILHPGADISKVKLAYKGVNESTVDLSGNILFSTKFGNITEHTPLSFYSNDNGIALNSSMLLQKDNSILFTIKNYDKTREMVFDPWVTTPVFNGFDSAFEVEVDGNGNVYVYGSDNMVKLRKLDKNGVAEWTYTTSWLVAGWIGDLAVDSLGNSYISRSAPGSNIQKINSSGSNVWSTNNTINFIEPHVLALNTKQDTLYASGAAGLATSDVAFVNMSNGNYGNVVNVGTNVQFGGTTSEVRGVYFINNNIYFITTALYDVKSKLLAFNSRLNLLYNVDAYYDTSTFYYSMPRFKNGLSGIPNSSCLNAIASDGCYVYTYNGSILVKNNISNGSYIKHVFVSDAEQFGDSGVLIDTCGNIYVGTLTGVSMYDKELNFIDSISTPDAVYGIAFGKNNDILACGKGFVGSFPSLTTGCSATSMSINLTSTTTSIDSGSATVSVTGGNPPYRYLWSNGSTTATIGNVPLGTYSVTVYSSAKNCVDLIEQGEVTIRPGDYTISVKVPNIFTPNGDDKNDFFSVSADGVNTMLLEIFNRWGEKVYETNNINSKWDGKTKNGNIMPDGVYYYVLSLKFVDDKTYTKKGDFSLYKN